MKILPAKTDTAIRIRVRGCLDQQRPSALSVWILLENLLSPSNQLLSAGLIHPSEHGVKHVFDFHSPREGPYLDAGATTRATGINVERRNVTGLAAMPNFAVQGK